MWPFRGESKQRAFGAIAGILGLFLTAIGLAQTEIKIFGFPLLSIGFVIFIIGLFYLIEVTFN